MHIFISDQVFLRFLIVLVLWRSLKMQALKEYVFPHLAFQLLPYTWDTRKKIPNFALLKIGSIPGGWFGVCHKFDSGMHKQWVYYRLHFGFRETESV